MSDRKRAIETLKQLRLDYEEFYEEHNNEVTQAYDMAISSLETDEAYQLEYESTTKNDLVVDCIVDVLGSYTDLDIPYKREIAENILTKLSSETPQEPKTGHWNEIPKYKDIAWQCSECGHFTTMKHNFCADCGCHMIEPQESEEA